MNSPLMTQIGQRVVAWHNRHPLARRVTLAHIHSIGVVAMPFDHVEPEAADPAHPADGAPPPGRLAALRLRLRGLLARLRLPRRRKVPPISADGRQAVFDEDFVGSLPEGEVRRWAEQHALLRRPGEDDWPQRDVPVGRRWAGPASTDGDAAAPALSAARRADLNDLIVDLSDHPAEADPEPPSGLDSGEPTTGAQIRWAVTAAIDVDGARRRLLLTNAARPAILGRRALSPARLVAATALLSLLGASAVALPWLNRTKAAQAAAHAPAAASAASAASKPAPAASGASAAAAAASATSSAPSSAASSHGHEPAASAAADADNAQAASSAASAAASSPEAADAAHSHGQAHAATAPHPSAAGGGRADRLGADPRLARPATTAPVAAPAPAGPVFALVSRAAMSQAEPQVALQRMQAAAAELASAMPDTHAELVQQGGRWQAVWWPFRSRADATQARWALALKGVTVEVVEF